MAFRYLKQYTVTDGEVSEFAPTLAEARKTRTWMAKGIGLPPGELWIEETCSGRVIIGKWETKKRPFESQTKEAKND